MAILTGTQMSGCYNFRNTKQTPRPDSWEWWKQGSSSGGVHEEAGMGCVPSYSIHRAPLKTPFLVGKTPGEGNGSPLQYSCLKNPMDGRVWWAAVHRVAKSQDRTERLTDTHTWFSEFSWQDPGFKSPSLPSFHPLPCPAAPHSPISAFFIHLRPFPNRSA